MFRVIYEKRALKDFNNIPKLNIEKILEVLEDLTSNLIPIGAKKLSGKDGFYRIRQGDYRIIYLIDHKEKVVKIVFVAHRKDIYRNL